MVSDSSNGVYWRIIAAIAGLILIGANEPPKTSDKAETSNKQGEIANAINGIATAIKNPVETDQTTKPCAKNSDNRNSDLCAQWKAADAATDSANWSWWQVLLGGGGIAIGLLTFAAAFKAAQYAKKAADETGRAADEAARSVDVTRRIGEAQARCYLSGVTGNFHVFGTGRVTAGVVVKNTGQSPAVNLTWTAKLCVIPTGEGMQEFDGVTLRNAERVYSIGGGSEENLGPITFGEILNKINLQITPKMELHIALHAKINCHDVFDLPVVMEETFHTMCLGPIAKGAVLQLERGHKMQMMKQEAK